MSLMYDFKIKMELFFGIYLISSNNLSEICVQYFLILLKVCFTSFGYIGNNSEKICIIIKTGCY